MSRLEPKRADEHDPSERMRRAIDSPQGRRFYSQRIATVEPVFANIRHHKAMRRFTLRGRAKVSTQWNLFCLVHNIEKMAHYGSNSAFEGQSALAGPHQRTSTAPWHSGSNRIAMDDTSHTVPLGTSQPIVNAPRQVRRGG